MRACVYSECREESTRSGLVRADPSGDGLDRSRIRRGPPCCSRLFCSLLGTSVAPPGHWSRGRSVVLKKGLSAPHLSGALPGEVSVQADGIAAAILAGAVAQWLNLPSLLSCACAAHGDLRGGVMRPAVHSWAVGRVSPYIDGHGSGSSCALRALLDISVPTV